MMCRWFLRPTLFLCASVAHTLAVRSKLPATPRKRMSPAKVATTLAVTATGAVFVTPPGWAAAGRRADLERVARAAAKGGAALVQLRDADASIDELETAAAAVRDALQGTDCSVVINGVEHLPERKWRAATERPNGPLGCSAHSVEAVLAAAALGAD